MFTVDPASLLKAALCFLRISGILFALPLFGDSTVPLRVRLFLSIAISICVYPVVSPTWAPPFEDSAFWLAVLVLRELLLGLVIGFTGKMMFEGVILGANLVGYQMGFGTGSLMFGDSSAEMTSFTALHRIIVMMIFLALSLHHVFITTMVSTFELIPAGGATPSADLTQTMIQGAAAIFTTAMQLAAPILVAMLFTMAALGLIARTVPQLNVFTISFPISFFIGLAIYIASNPYFISWLREYFAALDQELLKSISGLKP